MWGRGGIHLSVCEDCVGMYKSIVKKGKVEVIG